MEVAVTIISIAAFAWGFKKRKEITGFFIKEKEEEIMQLREENRKLTEELQTLKRASLAKEPVPTADEGKMEIEKLIRDLSNIKQEKEKYEKDNDQLKTMLSTLKKNLKEVQEQLEHLREAEAQLKQSKTKDEQKIKEQTAELKGRLDQLREKLSSKTKELDHVQNEHRDRERALASKLEEYRRKLENLETLRLRELQDSSDEISSLKSKLTSLERKVKEMEDTAISRKSFEKKQEDESLVVKTPVVETKTENSPKTEKEENILKQVMKENVVKEKKSKETNSLSKELAKKKGNLVQEEQEKQEREEKEKGGSQNKKLPYGFILEEGSNGDVAPVGGVTSPEPSEELMRLTKELEEKKEEDRKIVELGLSLPDDLMELVGTNEDDDEGDFDLNAFKVKAADHLQFSQEIPLDDEFQQELPKAPEAEKAPTTVATTTPTTPAPTASIASSTQEKEKKEEKTKEKVEDEDLEGMFDMNLVKGKKMKSKVKFMEPPHPKQKTKKVENEENKETQDLRSLITSSFDLGSFLSSDQPPTATPTTPTTSSTEEPFDLSALKVTAASIPADEDSFDLSALKVPTSSQDDKPKEEEVEEEHSLNLDDFKVKSPPVIPKNTPTTPTTTEAVEHNKKSGDNDDDDDEGEAKTEEKEEEKDDEKEAQNFLESFKVQPKQVPAKKTFAESSARMKKGMPMPPPEEDENDDPEMAAFLRSMRGKPGSRASALFPSPSSHDTPPPQQQQHRDRAHTFPTMTDEIPVLQDPTIKPPSFLDIFRKPNEEPLTPSIETLPPWQPTDPIVRGFSVKEDMNKRGMRRVKKRPMHWGSGSTKVKPEMEDVNYISVPFQDPSKALFCVFDGHAGKDCAVAASQIIPKELAKRLDTAGDVIDLTDLLKELFLDVDQQLSQYEFLGCTATIAIVRKIGNDRYLQAANVGDSSAFLFRGDRTEPVSKDHKASDPEERDRIVASGIPMLKGQTRVGGLAVSRALGDHCVKQENVGMIAEPFVSPPIKLQNSDSILVLASDGLWDVMDGEKAMSLIQESKNAEWMSRRLINSALADAKCNDNITVMVVVL